MCSNHQMKTFEEILCILHLFCPGDIEDLLQRINQSQRWIIDRHWRYNAWDDSEPIVEMWQLHGPNPKYTTWCLQYEFSDVLLSTLGVMLWEIRCMIVLQHRGDDKASAYNCTFKGMPMCILELILGQIKIFHTNRKRIGVKHTLSYKQYHSIKPSQLTNSNQYGETMMMMMMKNT